MILSLMAVICAVAKSGGNNALLISASRGWICFSFNLDGCGGTPPQRKIAHLKGSFADGFSIVNCTRYVATRQAPWEKAITPS